MNLIILGILMTLGCLIAFFTTLHLPFLGVTFLSFILTLVAIHKFLENNTNQF